MEKPKAGLGGTGTPRLSLSLETGLEGCRGHEVSLPIIPLALFFISFISFINCTYVQRGARRLSCYKQWGKVTAPWVLSCDLGTGVDISWIWATWVQFNHQTFIEHVLCSRTVPVPMFGMRYMVSKDGSQQLHCACIHTPLLPSGGV